MFENDIKKQLEKCARCALCAQNCPVYNVKKDENYSPRGLICKLNALLEGVIKEADVKKELKICLNCSRCRSNCPSGVDTTRIFAYKNAELSPSRFSARVLLFVKLLPLKVLYFLNFFKKTIKPKSSTIVYFKGCVARAQHKTTFLDNYPSDNLCCGLPYLTSGDIKNYQKVKTKNLEIIKKASKVVFDCASCKACVEEYDELSEKEREKLVFFFDVSKKIKIKSKYKKYKTVTFHKPCHLAKEEFRKIEKILYNLDGIKYIPPENSELCCGFGGSYFIFHPLIALKIALKSARQIKATGADLALTMCPSCTLGVRFGQIISGNFKKTLELRDFFETY